MGGFWDVQFKDIVSIAILVATIWAIYYGPIKAVEISRKNQEEDGKRARQFGVLHNLIKTRAFRLSPDHVTALNLVQLEFYGNDRIQNYYKVYMALLNGVWPEPGSDGFERFNGQVVDALYDLIHEIGLVLDFRIDKQDLMRLAYGPRGWQTDEDQQRVLRHLLVMLLEG